MSPTVTYGSPTGRAVIAAAVLGSGMAFLDGSIVNVALRSIGEDLDASLAELQWITNGYLLSLASLILLGGSLGDRYGRRRVFVIGTLVFAAASLLCGLAPTPLLLIVARVLQGIGGALLTPGSLAMIQGTFVAEDRGRAIGSWSGLGGIAAAIGPFVGGALIDYASWRWIFLINLPLAAATIFIAQRVPETSDPSASHQFDVAGAALGSLALGATTYGLIEWGSAASPVAAIVGVGSAIGFLVVESRSSHPMLPLRLFRDRTFSAANAMTFLVYAALSGMVLWLVVTLQVVAGQSPMRAGFALLPLTVCMLLLSPLAGSVSERIGPTIPMTVGPLIMAGSVAALSRVDAHTSYLVDVIAPTIVFGIGLATMVTPLTATALAAVPDHRAGIASGVNNAVARIGGLLAVAVLPLATSIGSDGFDDAATLHPAYVMAMWICAGLLAASGLLSAALVRRPEAVS